MLVASPAEACGVVVKRMETLVIGVGAAKMHNGWYFKDKRATAKLSKRLPFIYYAADSTVQIKVAPKVMMIRTILTYMVLCCAIPTAAQWVTIPDPGFVQKLLEQVPDCMFEDQLDTSCSTLSTTTTLDLVSAGITDLTGIEYFTSLSELYVDDNALVQLPPLPPTLTVLWCGSNSLTALPELPMGLTTLVCPNNALTVLPELPATLNHLDVSFNAFNLLPQLPSSLTYLDCSSNVLVALPTLPAFLGDLVCFANALTSLPALPNALTKLYCQDNMIISLPLLPGSLMEINCGGNPLTSLPVLPASLLELGCSACQLSTLPSLPEGLTSLSCASNMLTALPELPQGLLYLNCQDNQITCLPNLPGSLVSNSLSAFNISGNLFTCLPNYVPAMSGPNAGWLNVPLCTVGISTTNPYGCSPQCSLEGSVATYSECVENAIEMYNGIVMYYEFVEWSGGTPPYSGYVESSYFSGSFSNEYGNGWVSDGQLFEEGPFQVYCYLSITDAEGCEFEFSTSEGHNWLFAYDRFMLSSTVWNEQSGTATVTLVDNPARIGNLVGSTLLEYAVSSETSSPPTFIVGMISDLYVPGPPRLVIPDLAPGTYSFSIGKFLPGGEWAYPEYICTGEALTFTITAPEPEQMEIQISALLGGAGISGGLMQDDLRSSDLLPLTEPYTQQGYTLVGQHGPTSVLPAVLGVSGSSAVVDWLLVELRDPIAPASVVASTPALLLRNGDVVDPDGVSPVAFQIPAGGYMVALHHRNHLGVMTAAPVALSASPAIVDFTNPSTPTWGINAQRNANGTMVLWPGDGDGNGSISYTGTVNDRDPILQAIGGIIPTNTVQGVYDVRDINMDGTVRYTGTGNDRDVILQTIGGTVPTAVRVEQMP